MTADQLVPLNRSRRETVVYTFHAISGGVTSYSSLAAAIEDVAVVKGVVSPGREPGGCAFENIHDMAAAAASSIVEDSRDSPYALLGWCMGGLIAYEAANTLGHAHRRPEFVALIDTNLVLRPEPARAPELERLYWSSLGQILAGRAWTNASLDETLALRDESARLDYMFALARSRPSPFNLEPMLRLVNVFKAHWSATQSYKPTPPSVDFTFLAAADSPYPNAAQSWRELSGELSTVERLPGTHFSMLEQPHLGELSAWVRRSLQ